MKPFKLPARLWQTLLLVLTAAAFSPLSVFAAEAGEEAYTPSVYATAWALLPPIIAIGLALITKEVYSSLFLGIVMGGLLYSGFSFEGTTMHVLEDGFISVLSDSYNVGILIFLVILGTMVSLMNRAGGSAAFGRWAQKKIKTRVGAQLSAIALGILIFIDDYFNCLTVGSVMRPVTDSHKVSRAKLSYLIDATAAPICIIAPISSWAAAVSGFVEGEDGFSIFVRAIPYNYYALFTIAMMILITVWNFDYGPMAKYETNALKGDLFSDSKEEKDTQRTFENPNGRVARPHSTGSRADRLLCPRYAVFRRLLLQRRFRFRIRWQRCFRWTCPRQYFCPAAHDSLLLPAPDYELPGMLRLSALRFQGNGSRNPDPDLCLDLKGHDRQPRRCGFCCRYHQPGSWKPDGAPACHHLPDRCIPCLCHRNQLGNLWYPDPDRCCSVPEHRPAADDYLHLRLHGRRCLRRPLLPYLRYDDHGFRRCTV